MDDLFLTDDENDCTKKKNEQIVNKPSNIPKYDIN